MLRLLAIAIVVASTVGPSAQSGRRGVTPGSASPRPLTVAASGCSPSGADLRKAAISLHAANSTNPGAFFSALDRFVGVDIVFSGNSGNVTILHTDALSIFLASRYSMYHTNLSEKLRKMESIDALQVVDAYSVVVSPSQMDSPDIERIVVQRDGKIVAPLVNRLIVQPFQNRMGASTMLHSGAVLYPCSAFAPSSVVTITAIPASGSNVIKTLTVDELKSMR